MKKILIIEDEPDVAETIKMLVEREGYTVDVILDPVKALDQIKKYDLVLLDIIMPRMSGREVLSEMKKRGLKVPVIVVSAVGLPEEVSSELNAKYGEVGFVPKTQLNTSLIEDIKKKIGK